MTNIFSDIKPSTEFVVASKATMFVYSEHRKESAASRSLHSIEGKCDDCPDVYTRSQWLEVRRRA